MTLDSKILRDLASGRATPDAIARRLGIEEEVAAATLQRLLKQNLVQTTPLGPLTIYRLRP